MEEFAALSGVSRPTVSKYFNDPQSVRPSSRTRIEEALERYDYRPNFFAVNQNRMLTKNIGIVVPYLADPFFAEIARTIELRCLAAGFAPTLFSAHGEPELENQILNVLRSLKPAGALLAPLGKTSDQEQVARFCDDVPTVLFDSNIPGVGECFVGSDNQQFVTLLVEYLTRTGEPPCFFEMAPINPNANRRRNAYTSVMENLGLEPIVLSVPGTGWDFEEVGYQGALSVIDSGSLVTNTVLCSNDRLAIGFLRACYERGLRVGHKAGCDLRVAGIDDHPFSRYTSPPLTTVAQNYSSISEKSTDTLFKLIEAGASQGTRIETLFEGKLVMRASA